ncbi:MAG: hypothetical protein WCW77_00550 [Patescibacteria group bacterium]
MSLLSGFFSLAKNFNKSKGDSGEQTEGVISDFLPELKLNMEDSELISLSTQWQGAWKDEQGNLEKRQEQNKNYWLGKHYSKAEDLGDAKPLADNLIFESLEAFLPVATKQRPEPLVVSDNSKEGEDISGKVQKMLIYQADTQKLKLKIKGATRHWAINLLGVVKVGWSERKNDIDTKVISPKDLILDPDATIDEDGYTGEYIGHYRKDSASNLIKRFPKKSKFIKDLANGKMGTKLKYIEWWTAEYTFWRLGSEILDKIKNPHWNYDDEKEVTDELGGVTKEKVEGNNHFTAPAMPFIFLSVYNLGEKPFDITSIIEQNISLQDLINKRLKQIDKNADKTNGGMAISGQYLTEEQAKKASEAVRKGGTIYLSGVDDIRKAVINLQVAALPAIVYNTLTDYRGELRNIFGTRGLTSQGISQEKTVRGKIIASGVDNERAGGGISEYIEQFSDQVFNWWTQLIYVYYDEEHTGSIIGKDRAREYVILKNSDLNRKILVSVKEGSMIPKDSLSKRNEAIELYTGGALDPITLFDKLEFSDPKEAALKLFLWKTNPMQLLSGDLSLPTMPLMPGATPTPGQIPGGPEGQPPVEQGGESLLAQVPIQ